MQWGDEVIKVWQAHAEPLLLETSLHKVPGSLLSVQEEGLRVACAEGVLCLTQLQKAGGKRQSATDFVRSFKAQVGDVFQS
jgi:methionyl-tRNA formyltransferase